MISLLFVIFFFLMFFVTYYDVLCIVMHAYEYVFGAVYCSINNIKKKCHHHIIEVLWIILFLFCKTKKKQLDCRKLHLLCKLLSMCTRKIFM